MSGVDTWKWLLVYSTAIMLVACGNVSPGEPPRAVDDSVIVYQNNSIDIYILDNDSGNDLQNGVVAIVKKPLHGSTKVLPEGVVRYTPRFDYLGFDNFQYEISDKFGRKDRATVKIEVKKPGVLEARNDRATTREDEEIIINVLNNDIGNALNEAFVTIGEGPRHGKAIVIDKVAIRYVPAKNYNGKDSLEYVVKDKFGQMSSATVEIAISPVNDAPVINLLASVDENGATKERGLAPFTTNIIWEVTDVDGDPLNCSLNFGDGEKGRVDCGKKQISHEYKKVGDYQLEFSIDDGKVSNSKNITIHVITEYSITLRFETELTDAQRRAFNWAAKRWSEVIVGDVDDVASFEVKKDTCGNKGDVKLDIDDLVIFVNVEKRDGEGGILGWAGPCFIRAGDNLPFVGQITLDVDDLKNLEDRGTLNSTILHEMGHVLGIGTVWQQDELLKWEDGVKDCLDADEIDFIGNSASQEWQNTFGRDGNPPVENEGGAGTKCGHWRESVFDSELMTGLLNGNRQPLSRITAASLDDLGYRVNMYAADEFDLPQNNLVAPQGNPGILLKERLIYPMVAPDAQ